MAGNETAFTETPVRLSSVRIGSRVSEEVIREILLASAESSASDIFFKTGTKVLSKVHGVFHPVGERKLEGTEVVSVLRFLFNGDNGFVKVQAAEPVDGSVTITANDGTRIRFRFNATGCLAGSAEGVDITVRIINGNPPSLAELGVEEEVAKNLIPDDGLVLVSGPTGSGKSTLLAGAIRSGLEDPSRHLRILSYEDPVEYVYDRVKGATTSHITQTEVSRFLRDGFPGAGRNYVRRAPNVILFGEARDRDTMDGALEGANTGHTVLTTVHSQGVPETLKRVADLYQGEDKPTKMLELLDCLRLVVSQRLIPRVDGGRIAVREYMVFDAELRERLAWIEDPARLVLEARNEIRRRGQTMFAHAKKHHALGLITDLDLERFRRRDAGGHVETSSEVRNVA